MQDDMLVNVRSISVINLVLGVWLVISPFILSYTTTSSYWNQIIFGAIVGILAIVRLVSPRMTWPSWINSLIGLWLIVSPFILNYVRDVAYWNAIILGVVVAILGYVNGSVFTQHAKPA